jgi:multiple sugar transport system permease protein
MVQHVADTSTVAPYERKRFRVSEETKAGFLTISPWIFGFIVFTAFPFFASFFLSFTRYDVINPPEWIGLDNYERLLTRDRYFPKAVQNTVIYAVFYIPANIVTSLGAAILLNSARKWKGFFRTAFYLPAMTPAVATAYIWLWALNPNDGVINQILRWLNLPAPAWTVDPAWTKPAIVVSQVWMMGGAMILFLAALQGVPRDLYESAMLDGAGRWERFRSVTLPMISGVTFFVATISTISALSVFTEGYVMFNEPYGGPSQSALFIVMYLYDQAFSASSLRMGYASAIAWLLFLMILVVTIIQFRLSKLWVYYEHSND